MRVKDHTLENKIALYALDIIWSNSTKVAVGMVALDKILSVAIEKYYIKHPDTLKTNLISRDVCLSFLMKHHIKTFYEFNLKYLEELG